MALIERIIDSLFKKQIQIDLGIMTKNLSPKIITNSTTMVRKYLMNSSTTLGIATMITGLDEVMNELIKFRQIDDDLMKKNKMGIIILKNKKLKKYETEFLSILKESFDNYKI